MLTLEPLSRQAEVVRRARARLADIQKNKAKYDADLEVFAGDCLTIRPKAGSDTLLRFNRVQKRVHAEIEKQRRETGMVRILILKARQHGVCLAPHMRVLTADLRWVPVGSVQLGDELVATDEDAGKGRGADRKLRTCEVEAVASRREPTYRLVLENGVELIATGPHRFLSRQRGGDYCQWRAVEKTKAGDVIRYVADVHGPQTIEDAWFGGLVDGEGTLRPKSRAGVELSVSQVDGPVLARARRYLQDRGYTFREEVDRRKAGASSKLGNQPVHRLVVSRMSELFRLLGGTRPTRFVKHRWWEGKSLPGKKISNAWLRVVAIESLGPRRVIDLQTSTQTFVCEGIVSHNSTYVAARFYHRVSRNQGLRAFVLTHEQDATDNLFGIVQRFHEHNPHAPVTGAASAKELAFSEFDSGFDVGTAGTKGVGRSYTIQLFHWSEVAFSPNAEDHSQGILQAIASAQGTEAILESTANGMGGLFYNMCMAAMRGIGQFRLIFIPWFDHDEYQTEPPEGWEPPRAFDEYAEAHDLTLAQLFWAYQKNAEMATANGATDEELYWGFRQEYPSTIEEAFRASRQGAYISPDLVLKARKTTLPVVDSLPLIFGCDLACGGDGPETGDENVVIDRQGRVAGRKVYERSREKDSVAVAGWLAGLIDKHKPDMVFIDTGGGGAGVHDILKARGYRNVALVNFGAKANDDRQYRNKRAELYGNLLEWLSDPGGADIPDDDVLDGEITGPQAKENANRQIILEPKIKVRERIGRSPDGSDALGTTLAETVHKRNQSQSHLPAGGPRRSGAWMGA